MKKDTDNTSRVAVFILVFNLSFGTQVGIEVRYKADVLKKSSPFCSASTKTDKFFDTIYWGMQIFAFN